MIVFNKHACVKCAFILSMFLPIDLVFSETNCTVQLSISEAKAKVKKWRMKLNFPQPDESKQEKITFEKSKMGCHYYYSEVSAYNAHLDRAFILDESGEVMDYDGFQFAKPEKLGCPLLKLKSGYFLKQIKKKKLFLERKISKSELNPIRCLYDYTVSFSEKIKPAGITFYFDYKGRMISWTPVNAEYIQILMD